MSPAHRFLHADSAGGSPLPSLVPRPMDFFKLQDRFWQLDAEQSFSPAETRLYMYWLNRFNKEFWPASLPRTVKQVAADLGMDEKTIDRARKGLEERALITYQAGNKKVSAQWILPAQVERKNSGQSAKNSPQIDRNFSGANAGNPENSPQMDRKNSAPIYKEKTKTSSVVENKDEEEREASSSAARSEEKVASQPASQKAEPQTEGGGGRRPSPHADDAQLTTADACPLLNVPATFKAACLDIDKGYAGIDFEHYRLDMRFDSLEQGLKLMPYQWRKRLRHWLTNAKNNRGGLILAPVPGETKGDPRAIKPLAAKSSASPTKTRSWS